MLNTCVPNDSPFNDGLVFTDNALFRCPLSGGSLSRRDLLSTLFAVPAVGKFLTALQPGITSLATNSATHKAGMFLKAAHSLWPTAAGLVKDPSLNDVFQSHAFSMLFGIRECLPQRYRSCDSEWNTLSFDADIIGSFLALAKSSGGCALLNPREVATLHGMICPEDRYFSREECRLVDSSGRYSSPLHYLPVAYQSKDGSFNKARSNFLKDRTPTPEQLRRWEFVVNDRNALIDELNADPKMRELLKRIKELQVARRKAEHQHYLKFADLLDQQAARRARGTPHVGPLLVGEAAEFRAYAAEPIITPSSEYLLDLLRSFVRTLHFFYQDLPQQLAENAAHYQPNSIGIKLLRYLMQEGWDFTDRLDVDLLEVLRSYSHAAAEVLRFGEHCDSRMIQELKDSRKLLKEKFGITESPRRARVLDNPCRAMTLASLPSRIHARAKESAVDLYMRGSCGELNWQHNGVSCWSEVIVPQTAHHIFSDPHLLNLHFAPNSSKLQIIKTLMDNGLQ